MTAKASSETVKLKCWKRKTLSGEYLSISPPPGYSFDTEVATVNGRFLLIGLKREKQED